MLLGNPNLLMLLPVVILGAAVYARQRSGAAGRQLLATVALRCAALALLVLALARPVAVAPGVERVAVAVVDASSSVGSNGLVALATELERWQVASKPAADVLRIVVGGARPYVLPAEPVRSAAGWLTFLQREAAGRDADRADSPLAETLELAGSCCPHGAPGTVTLLSDGLATRGDALAAAMRLGARGIALHTVALGAVRTDELVLAAARLPAQARRGATVPLTLELDSGRAGRAEVMVTPTAGGAAAVRAVFDLRAGRQTVTLPVALAEDGVRSFDVRCAADWDSTEDNNSTAAAIWVAPAGVVAVLERDPGRPCRAGLEALLGASAEVQPVSAAQLADDPAVLQTAQALVVADTPARELPPDVQQNIIAAVKRGLGLWFVGGRHGFGPGGYAGSALAEILPLDASEQAEKRDPSVTLVIIIDTSGSMKGPRIDLAKEVARLAIERLQPHDKVGIVEFYGAKRWAARIQSAGNRIDIQRALNRLSAGGGTIILPALEEAYYALLNVHTRTKHVLIVTDGGVETGAFEDMITRMADAGITVSTVVAGPGQYSGFLTSLAHWGHGKSYSAPDRFHLPEIILKQPEEMPAAPFVEQPRNLIAASPDGLTRTLALADAPPLGGHVRTRARPTADLLLATADGDPVLARWRFGRGFVAAYTADLGGPWSAELTRWPPFGGLVADLVREIAAPAGDDALQVGLVRRPAGVEVQVSYVGHEPGDLLAPLRLVIHAPDGARSETDCDPVSPGAWNDLVGPVAAGILTVEAQTGDGRFRGRGACGIAATPEIAAARPDQEFLDGLAAAARAALPPAPRIDGRRYRELWPWCALAALGCLWLSVLARRWPLTTPPRLAAALCVALWLGGASPAAASDPLAEALRADDRGETAAALDHLAQYAPDDPARETAKHLLEGLFAVRAGRLADAQAAYARAAVAAPNERERTYALLRQIQTARQAGALGALADEWLADRASAPDRLCHLLGVLRELGRVDDALTLLQLADVSSELRAAVENEDFQRELVATVLDAGRDDVAVGIYQQRIVASPEALQWRVALARLLLRSGEADLAEQTLRAGLAVAGDEDARYAVAAAARQLALDTVAKEAVKVDPEAGPEEQLRSALWLAELYDQRGDRAAALAEIERVAPRSADDPGRLRKIADAYERFDQPARAVAVLEALAALAADPALDERRAWLLENLQRLDEARTLWLQLWENATSPAREQRAADRLLDLSAQTGQLADLAIRLEGKLLAQSATPAEIALLVEIYTRLGDAVSTTEILYLFGRQEGQQLAATRQLAQAYVQMGRLARADEALRRLLELDPAHRFDYLQELAVLAVERQRPDVADWAIAEMAETAGDPVLREELSAGVRELLGDYSRAADAYAATLAAHPERIEVWLLWARAEQQAGRVDAALARLQAVAASAEEDDLFLVAVDGLLNLEAPPAVLREALALVRQRSAAAPHKLFYYDVAADLLDALGDAEAINPLMERALVFAGPERGALLREMIERARSQGARADVIACGNLLVGMDYQVPPQVFLDLGRALLAEDKAVEADRAFQHGRSLGDDGVIGLQVADAFDDALLPTRALAVVDELLLVDPSNVALLHRAAALQEQLGDHAGAAQRYRLAYAVLGGRLAATGGTAEVPLQSRTNGVSRKRIAANIDEVNQYFDPTVDGMMICARTPEERADVVAFLRTQAEAALAAAQAAPGDALAAFPQLGRMAAGLRHAAISFHQPEVADAFDRALLARFPADAALSQLVIDERLHWGLTQRALALARAAIPPERWPAALQAGALLEDEAQLAAALAGGELASDLAENLIVRLVLAGRDDAVRSLLTRPAEGFTKLSASCARQMVVACAALNDRELLQAWSLRYLAQARAEGAAKAATAVREIVRINWPLQDGGRRAALLQRLADAVPAGAPAWLDVALLRVGLADELGTRPADWPAILDAAAAQADRSATIAADLLPWIEPGDAQAHWLDKAWSRCAADKQMAMLLDLAGRYAVAVPAELDAAFVRALGNSSPMPLDRHRPYSALVQSGWAGNQRQPALGLRCAERMLAAYPQSPAALTAAAEACATAGERERAAQLAHDALQRILADRDLDAEDVSMLQVVARRLAPAERADFTATARQRASDGAAGTLEILAAATMLAEMERDGEALQILEFAFRRAPADQLVRRALLDAVEQSGRWPELAPLLEPFLSDSAVVQSLEINRLAEAYRHCLRPRDALRVLKSDNSVMSRINVLELENALGERAHLRLRFRRYLAINRLEQRYYSPRSAVQPLIGGLEDYLVRQDPDFERFQSVFARLADNPDVSAELDALWETAFPARRDVPGLATARLEAARRANRLDAIAETLSGRLAEGTFQARDMQMLVELLLNTDVELRLPPDATGWVPGLADATHGDALDAWARMLLAADRGEAAANLLRWLVASDLLLSRRDTDASIRLRRLDRYGQAVSPAGRAAELEHLLAWSVLTPADDPSDAFDAALLARSAGGERAAIVRYLSRAGAASYLPRIHRTLARTAALRADAEVFEDQVNALVQLCDSAYGSMFPPDPMQFLPAPEQLSDPEAWSRRVATGIERSLEQGRLKHADAVKMYVLLAQWGLLNGTTASAVSADLLQAAAEQARLASDNGLLWIADLAKSLAPSQAVEWQIRAFDAGVLPMARAAQLLEAVAALQGDAAAGELALRISRFTDDPAVLRRAVDAARGQGDADMSRRLQQRIEGAAHAQGAD